MNNVQMRGDLPLIDVLKGLLDEDPVPRVNFVAAARLYRTHQGCSEAEALRFIRFLHAEMHEFPVNGRH